MEDNLVTVVTENFARAQILKARLESDGIECTLSNLNLIQSSVSDGVRVKVKESDVKKAIQLYLSIKKEFTREGKKKNQRGKLKGNILVPVDFSENSFNAACFATYMAHIYKTEINIFHVYYMPVTDIVNAPDLNFSQYSIDIVLQDLQKRAKKQMNNFVKRIMEFAKDNKLDGLRIRKTVVEGLTADMILSEAKSFKANYVIIGTHGESHLKKDILGSIVWTVIQKSRLPVIAIPDGYHFIPGRSSYNVMFTSDLDETTFVALRKLASILKPFEKIKFHCVHVSNTKINEFQKAQMNALKEYMSNISSYKLTVQLIESKDYIKAFDIYLKENNIDMLCMSTKKRNLIERFFSPSLAKRMLYHTTTPLLVIQI
ncbi:MAG: universal stress protein [Bacteroidales bacterium]|nr:universal stress protein [Bacteroidales bacterium]